MTLRIMLNWYLGCVTCLYLHVWEGHFWTHCASFSFLGYLTILLISTLSRLGGGMGFQASTTPCRSTFLTLTPPFSSLFCFILLYMSWFLTFSLLFPPCLSSISYSLLLISYSVAGIQRFTCGFVLYQTIINEGSSSITQETERNVCKPLINF